MTSEPAILNTFSNGRATYFLCVMGELMLAQHRTATPSSEMDRPAPETSEGTSTINTAKNNKKKEMNIKMIISKNVSGLKLHKNNEEFFHHLRRRRPFAALLQETWLTGDETLES